MLTRRVVPLPPWPRVLFISKISFIIDSVWTTLWFSNRYSFKVLLWGLKRQYYLFKTNDGKRINDRKTVWRDIDRAVPLFDETEGDEENDSPYFCRFSQIFALVLCRLFVKVLICSSVFLWHFKRTATKVELGKDCCSDK